LLATTKQNYHRSHADWVRNLQVQQDKKAQKRKDLEKGQIEIAKADFAEATWLHQQLFCQDVAKLQRGYSKSSMGVIRRPNSLNLSRNSILSYCLAVVLAKHIILGL